MERARATAGTSIASWRVVNGDINKGWKFWVGRMFTAAVTVRGSAAFISEVSENTSNNPIMKLCALFVLVANYATLCNAVHRVAGSVQKS
jgi:hypothetical protein